MPTKPLVLLVTMLLGPTALCGPPESVSGRMMVDLVSEVRAEVQQREREFARAKSDPALAEKLAEARARLAGAEGRLDAAAAGWRKVVESRKAAMGDLEAALKAGQLCSGIDLVLLRGKMAEARYRLAEVEGDRTALAAELPKVIAYYEFQLGLSRDMRAAGVLGPEDAREEQATRGALRAARRRLDAMSEKGRADRGPPGRKTPSSGPSSGTPAPGAFAG